MDKKYLQPKLSGEYKQLLRYNASNSWQNKWEAVDVETSPTWFSPEIRVCAVANCTVKAMEQEITTVIPYETSGDYYFLRIPNFGTWEVIAEKDGRVDSEVIHVDKVKQYRVDLLHELYN